MNFEKNFEQYEKNALIQKKVVTKLIDLVPKKNYETIFEIGCGTGIFSREISKQIDYKNFIINDKFSICQNYLKDIKNSSFLGGSVEDIKIPQADLVVSSSAFQWIDDKDKLFERIAASTPTLIFSIYIKDNLIEISDHFGISLKYSSLEELKKLLLLHFDKVTCSNEEFILNFNTPLEALHHLKNTGVTGFKKVEIGKIRNYEEKQLTYQVGYFICEKTKR